MLSLEQLAQLLMFDMTKDQVRAIVRVTFRAVFAFHIAFACGWFAFFGAPGFAKAAEIEGVKGQVAMLNLRFDRAEAQAVVDKLEIQIRNIDQEIFLIRAKLAELGRLGQQADALYERRLSTLETDKETAERRLERAYDHPALNYKEPSS